MSTVTEHGQLSRFTTPSDFRELVSPQLFDRLVGRIVKDEDVDQGLAEQIMESALGFLYLSASCPGKNLSPSPLVDIGWHTFILYTKGYADFCERVAGRFIHHEPNDNPEAQQRPGGIRRTIEAMVLMGLPYNEMLWTGRITKKKIAKILSNDADCSVDCDNGGGGPGGECSCS